MFTETKKRSTTIAHTVATAFALVLLIPSLSQTLALSKGDGECHGRNCAPRSIVKPQPHPNDPIDPGTGIRSNQLSNRDGDKPKKGDFSLVLLRPPSAMPNDPGTGFGSGSLRAASARFRESLSLSF